MLATQGPDRLDVDRRSVGANLRAPSRLLLSRLEANLNLGSHFDGVAAPNRRLITELRPRNGFTELHPGFKRSNFSFRAYDHFAANRCARGLPKGRGLHSRTFHQERALFVPGNRDFGNVLPLARSAFLRFRGIGAVLGSDRFQPPGRYSWSGGWNRSLPRTAPIPRNRRKALWARRRTFPKSLLPGTNNARS